MLKIFLRPQLAAIFLVLLYLSSCNKQEHGVGVGLYSNDNDLGAHFVDTFEINTYSKVLDSNFSITDLSCEKIFEAIAKSEIKKSLISICASHYSKLLASSANSDLSPFSKLT